MEPSNPFLELLDAYGVFTFLAYLLLFIVLYHLFKYLLEKYVKRLQDAGYRQIIAAVLSILITVLLYFLLAPLASSAATYIATIVFVLLFLFVVVVAAARIVGVDIPALLREIRS